MDDIEQYLKDPRTAYFAKEYKRLKAALDSLDRLRQEGMEELVREEEESITKQMDDLSRHIKEIVKEESFSEEGANEIVLEVRAGAGGDEASIFARDLAVMYERYATTKGFQFSRVSLSENNMNGYKEGVFRIQGKDVYDLLRFETGVHRVQRVPTTEKSGRIHTSTASVAILPIRKKNKEGLDMSDIKMDFSRSGGAGGQNVNKVESAVRMIHIPTGIEVRCTEERTQRGNRERALEILTAKVEMERHEKEDAVYATMRRSQIGTADRSEKIRTYNILQDRVTDHRIKKSWSNVEGILAGGIDGIMADIQQAYRDEMDTLSKEEEG